MNDIAVIVSIKKYIIITGFVTGMINWSTFLYYHYPVDPAVGSTAAIRPHITLGDDLFSTGVKIFWKSDINYLCQFIFYLCYIFLIFRKILHRH